MARDGNISADQHALCARFGVRALAAEPDLKAGVAHNVRRGTLPLDGLRHPPEGDTTGWYLWAGERLSDAADFFVPVHVSHLAEWCPDALGYLALPPGWRFQIAPGYEDVWEDPALLLAPDPALGSLDPEIPAVDDD